MKRYIALVATLTAALVAPAGVAQTPARCGARRRFADMYQPVFGKDRLWQPRQPICGAG
jgi:hypothetical protein